MTKTTIILMFILVTLLSLAALHDILKGAEPDLTSEYVILISSVIILSAMLIKLRRKASHEKH